MRDEHNYYQQPTEYADVRYRDINNRADVEYNISRGAER